MIVVTNTLCFRRRFLLFARYVPNVAKRSTWEQWGPTTDRLTSAFGKFQTAISRQRVIRSASCLVLGYGFRGRRIKWTYFRLYQIQDSAARHLGKFRMITPLEWVIRSTFMNYSLQSSFGGIQEKIMSEEKLDWSQSKIFLVWLSPELLSLIQAVFVNDIHYTMGQETIDYRIWSGSRIF